MKNITLVLLLFVFTCNVFSYSNDSKIEVAVEKFQIIGHYDTLDGYGAVIFDIFEMQQNWNVTVYEYLGEKQQPQEIITEFINLPHNKNKYVDVEYDDIYEAAAGYYDYYEIAPTALAVHFEENGQVTLIVELLEI